jgi:hypothetical protein
MPGDVSQFIQLQRLRSIQARQPSQQDKTITHLYQKQFLSSGITEFLPNIKDKITSGLTVQKYYYTPGIQSKPKIPGGYVWGYDSNTQSKVPRTLQTDVDDLVKSFTNIANASSFFSALDSLLKTAKNSLVIVTNPTLRAYYASLGIPNVPSIIYGIGGTLFQTHFLTYAASLSTPGNPAGLIIPSAYPITVAQKIYQSNPPPANTLTIIDMSTGVTTIINPGGNFDIGIFTFTFLGAGSPGLSVFYYAPELSNETAESAQAAYMKSINFATVSGTVDIGNTVLPTMFTIALEGDDKYRYLTSSGSLDYWGVYFFIASVDTTGTITSSDFFANWGGTVTNDSAFSVPGSNIYFIYQLNTSLNITPATTGLYGFVISQELANLIIDNNKLISISGLDLVTLPQKYGSNLIGSTTIDPNKVRMLIVELVGGVNYFDIRITES